MNLKRIISKIDSDAVRKILPSYSLIFDPDHPGMEPSLQYNNAILGKWFVAPFCRDKGLFTPFYFRKSIMEVSLPKNNIVDAFVTICDSITSTAQFYVVPQES